LIEGETGTGKELVARALHFSSPRNKKPFIAVNCSGLTESVLHSQLFGHKRGAFTDAVEDHKGVFEVAHEGTVFLDEIAGISPSVQASLLRVLDEKEITPLGESKPKKIDVRILAASNQDLAKEAEEGRFRPESNQDLAKEAEEGRFRPDLLYRIRVARIQLPPLRERREDIHMLALAFLAQSRATSGIAVEGLGTEVMKVLLEYPWPGNVRELKNAVEFAAIRCKHTRIQAADLPPEILESTSLRVLPRGSLPDEKDRVLAALKNAGGNRTLAARLLGISRATFYRRIASLEIELDE
jgi:DNA-binding NtrC family response regulator